MAKRKRKWNGRITLPILNSLLHHTLEDDVYVDGESFAMLLEIQRTLVVFEPIGDDEARMIWLEIPRGTAEEWKDFDDEHSWYSDPEEDNLASYQEALDDEYPYEKEWFFLVTSTYRENTFLKISDRDHRYVIFTNRHFREEARPTDMSWFMEPLLQLVKERVDAIVKDPDAYNRYIEENLPYRQRSGRIRSKDLNRILPERRLRVENREHCILVMKELILEETGWVRISPFTFHDYLQGGDDEGVIDLPFVEDCDKEGELTRKQYDEIVRLAEWEPEVQLKLDGKIPLEDAVYDLIREEVRDPVTLSKIRHRIEKKYETYLSVFEEDGYMGYYYVHSWDKQHSPAKSENYYPTFNEAMRALILEMGK